MSRRSRRRAEQFARAAAEELAAARAAADEAAADLVRQHAATLTRTRAAYDLALVEAGVVHFQQRAPGIDGYHLSTSMSAVLGWDPMAFLSPGILRGMVHPDDLIALAEVLPVGQVQAHVATPTAQAFAFSAPGTESGTALDAVGTEVAASAPLDTTDPDVILADATAGDVTEGDPGDPAFTDPTFTDTATPRTLDEFSVIDLTSSAIEPVAARSTSIETTARPAEHRTDEVTVRFRSAHGSWRRVLVRVTHAAHGGSTPADDTDEADGPLLRGSLVDVTDGEEMRSTSRRFAELVEHDPAGCLVLEFLDPADPCTLTIRAANPAARRMLDLERRVVDGTSIDTVFSQPSAQLVRSALFDVYHTGESMTAERLSFSEVPGTYLDMRVDRLTDGTLGMTIEDVTGTVAVEERLRHQASHDALTGLPNRTLLEERLAAATNSVTAAAPVALIVIDIDQLRDINQSHGLNLGDQLLVDIGRRLVRDVRGTAIVSRLGGDEFAVLTLPCTSESEAVERAAAVAETLARPFDVQGHLIECAVSIGVAISPRHGDDSRTMLRNANTALHADKGSTSPFTLFRRTEESSSIRRLALLSELRQGLANKDLELRYQPQIDLRTGRVTKVEAVLRWQRDEDSARMPMEFLELAEQSGLIQPLTRWILGETSRAALLLSAAAQSGEHDAGLSPLVVSTNLSLRNLFDPDLLTFVELLLRSGELRPELIELEVSETELMDDPARSQEVLTRLADSGLRFVVDDFGTGYTSLSTMQHLPVVGLKIDRSYVATIATVPADAAIVRSTIELSHQLGLTVSADGVPDAATLARLAEFGCDVAQGFHLSGPVTLEMLPSRIAELEAAVRGWIGTSDSVDI